MSTGIDRATTGADRQADPTSALLDRLFEGAFRSALPSIAAAQRRLLVQAIGRGPDPGDNRRPGLFVLALLDETVWDDFCRVPVAEDVRSKVPALYRGHREELLRLSIPESEVIHWLCKALELRAMEQLVRLLEEPPTSSRLERREIGKLKTALAVANLFPLTKKSLEFEIRIREEIRERFSAPGKILRRVLTAKVFGRGRYARLPLGARLAARGLADVLRSKTGRPHADLVAAILFGAGLLHHERAPACWTPSPTGSAAERKALWCGGKHIRGKGLCSIDRLRCGWATREIRAVIESG